MEGFKKYLTEYSKDETVYLEGEIQENFYIINKGKVQLSSKIDMVLAILSKGDFFGEESLIEDQNAKYSVRILEDATLIKIPYDQLTEMLKKSPDIALKILKKLSEKNLKIVDTVLNYETKSNETTGSLTKPDSKDKTTPPPPYDKEGKNEDEKDENAKLGKGIKAYIVIQKSNRLVQLEKKNTSIGRKDFTTGFIPDIDLTKEDDEKYISRKHASIIYSDGDFYFSEEPGAVNGTFLNGNKINTGIKYKINNGDKMTLCHIDVTFKC